LTPKPGACTVAAMSSREASAPAWRAERVVTVEEVAAWLLAEGYPVRRPPRLVGEGFDNFVFAVSLASGERYLRAARRRLAAPDIVKEVELLPRLVALGLPVPRPVIVPRDVATAPWPWLVYEPIPGIELGEALLSGVDLTATARALGDALRRLHDPALARSVAHFVPQDPYRRADIAPLAARAREHVAALEARFGLDPAPLRRALDDAADLGVVGGRRPGEGPALVHGDLHLRHALVEVDGAPSGVIDWGDAHLGSPAVDLHLMWALRTSEREAFLTAYGPVPPELVRASRVIAVFVNAVLALSARDFDLPGVEAAALLAARRAGQGDRE